MTEKPSVDNKEVAFELKHITKLYAGTVALDNVNLSVNKGEVHGLIGKNGAGKSTLVGIISGIISPSKGEMIINGNLYHSLTPITAKNLNISIITQEPQVIDESSVTENLFMPAYSDNKGMIHWNSMHEKAKGILKASGFNIEPYLKVKDLSISEKQLLLVIKACYVENAEIIIMDEVSASLNQKDQKILYDIIDDRIKAGKTIIFISHHTEELLDVCDRVTVIRDGHSVGCLSVSDLDKRSLAALIVGNTNYDAMIMEDKANMIEPTVAFELKDYTCYGKFKNINLSIHKGEVVGLAGLRGSGRTELFKSIVGIEKSDKGSIFLNGALKKYNSPIEANNDGIVYLPEERENEGLISISSIKKNLTMKILPEVSKNNIISNVLEKMRSDQLIKTLDIKAFSRDQEIQQLSGGNKQKVLVGKYLACEPLVCLLDEPTRGVDIEAKESILFTINEEMRKKSCVLITSPGLEDLIKICDRILVLYQGEIIEQFIRKEFNEEIIYRSVQGETIHS